MCQSLNLCLRINYSGLFAWISLTALSRTLFALIVSCSGRSVQCDWMYGDTQRHTGAHRLSRREVRHLGGCMGGIPNSVFNKILNWCLCAIR